MSEVEASVWVQGFGWRAHKFAAIPAVPRIGDAFRVWNSVDGRGDGVVTGVTWQLPTTGLEVDIEVACNNQLCEQAHGMLVAGQWELDLDSQQ